MPYNGPLEEIIDRFSTHKVLELQFADEVPADLARFGEVFDVQPPRAKVRIPRQKVPETLGAILSSYSIEDIGVHDRPLEEVIAEMFEAPAKPVA